MSRVGVALSCRFIKRESFSALGRMLTLRPYFLCREALKILDKYLVVALGGALGAVARFWLGELIGAKFPTRFPFGTLVINVSGSFIIGFFLTLVTDRLNIHPNWRLGVAVGFVGAYTTFSTFEYETFRLLE